jgi:integrase
MGKKERTIFGEVWYIKPFTDFTENKPLWQITPEDVENYVLHRTETRSKTTVHNGIIVLKNFYKWFNAKGINLLEPGTTVSTANLFDGIKTRQPKNYLPVDELILAEDVKELRDAATSQRNRAIIMILWDSAVRMGELINTNIGNVQFDKYGAVVIVNGKTGMRRIRLIDCVPDLQLWINMHPLRDDPEAPLFITDRKYKGKYRRLESQTINNMLNGLAKKAGAKKNIHPHAFRHGRLTDLAMRGFNEMELRIFAGWTKESNMPATYLHLSGADIEKKILQKNGIIEDDTKEREEKLRPIDCPRCKTRNPIGAKYCFTCSMVLDHKLAVEVQDVKTETIGQFDSTMMLEIMNLVKTFNEKQNLS